MRTRVDDNVVTILSSDDDEPPMQPPISPVKSEKRVSSKGASRGSQRRSAPKRSSKEGSGDGGTPDIGLLLRGDERHVSPTPVFSLRKGKGRKNAVSAPQKEDGPMVVATSPPPIQPSAQRDSSATPTTLPHPTATESADDQTSAFVAMDFDFPETQHDDTGTRPENVLAAPDSPEDVENLDTLPTVSTTPLPEHAHDEDHNDEELQTAIYRSLREDSVDITTVPPGHEPHDSPDTDILPPPAEPSTSVTPRTTATLPTPEPDVQVESPGEDIPDNASPEQHQGNENSSTLVRKATPLFLPPLDDEDQDAEVQGALYTSLSWKGRSDPCPTPPPDNAPPHELHASQDGLIEPQTLLADIAGEDALDNVSLQTVIYEASIQADGGDEFEPETMEIFTSDQYVPELVKNQIEEIPMVSASKPVVGVAMDAESVGSLQVKEGDRDRELIEQVVERLPLAAEDRPQDEHIISPLEDSDKELAQLESDPEEEGAGEARQTGLQNAVLHSSTTEGDDPEQAGGAQLADDPTTNPQLIRLSSPSEIDADELEPLVSASSLQQSLEEAYADEVLRCRYQLLERTPSYVDHNITYPSDPSTLLPRLRLHTPGFFSQSFALLTSVKEKEMDLAGQPELNDVVITQPTVIVRPSSPESSTVEPFVASSQPDPEAPMIDIILNDAIPTSSSPVSSSQTQEEAQVDALLLEEEQLPESTPVFLLPEGEDEMAIEVTAEFLENDPTLAAVLLESKMFMDILRDVQQVTTGNEIAGEQARVSEEPTLPEVEVSNEQARASDEPIHPAAQASDEQARVSQEPILPSHEPPSIPEEAQIGTLLVPEQVQQDDEPPSTPEQSNQLEHGSPPSPSSLNSSGTVQDSPSPPTPKAEANLVADADIFFIRSESPTEFNPDAFAAIMDIASPLPLAKEEDDYFSTHFFDYPDDLVA